MTQLREELEKLTAVEVAELFLSPHISEKLLLDATAEPGPSMWIVNRSDVSDLVLKKILKHPISPIAARAADKLKMRMANATHLSPPVIEEDLSKVEDYGIEDILGHPLCPWEAMLYYAINPSEDVRASSCLSLTRRLWEHPLQSQDFPPIESQFKDIFTILATEDISPMVRSYAARIPIWSSEEIADFLPSEAHPHVQAKWLQNDKCPTSTFEFLLRKEDLFLRRVLALDSRLPADLRTQLQTTSQDPLEKLIHEAQLL